MDLQPQTTKPISDDQELAKVLAGVSQETNDLGFEETPVAQSAVASPEPSTEDITMPQMPEITEMPEDQKAPVMTSTNQTSSNGELDSIKKDALTELRPLVDKLDLEPDEKFETYLLLIRSTDDKDLIAPAHLAAQNIPDEAKRARALLEIIKEIDFLSTPE